MSSTLLAIIGGSVGVVVAGVLAWYYHRQVTVLSAQVALGQLQAAGATETAQREATALAQATSAREADEARREAEDAKEDAQVLATNDAIAAAARLREAVSSASTAAGSTVSPKPTA